MSTSSRSEAGLGAATTTFRPVVDLQTERAVGALAGVAPARATTTMPLDPDGLAAELLDDLVDRWITASALAPRPTTSALMVPTSPESAEVWLTSGSSVGRAREHGVRLVVEIDQRWLAVEPRRLLRVRDLLHACSWGLAITGVGARGASLGHLALIGPDVVGLDTTLLHAATDVEAAYVVNAVRAHTASTGALVLAEGVDTEEHLDLAIAAGADLGRGEFHGGPDPEVPGPTRAVGPIDWTALGADRLPTTLDPWDLVRADPAVRQSRKPLLSVISRLLENQAFTGDPSTLVLATFQREDYLGRVTRELYERLADRGVRVAVLGVGMPDEPVPGVVGASIPDDDPIAALWCVTVLAPHFAAALIANEPGPSWSDEHERRFDYLVTYDRRTVVDASRVLISRFPDRAFA